MGRYKKYETFSAAVDMIIRSEPRALFSYRLTINFFSLYFLNVFIYLFCIILIGWG